MKKLATLIVAIGALTTAVSAQHTAPQTPGLSPLTRHYLLELSRRPKDLPENYIYRTDDDGRTMVSAMIKVADAAAAGEGLSRLGATIQLKAGNIWTVQVPAGQVHAFTTLAGIAYIQLDEPVFPKLDVARRTTRVDSVHRGINLPMVYNGKGVVMGVIDFGFDYNHPSFLDTLGGRMRIKKVWEMNGTGTHPAPFTYGRELADSNAIKAATTDNARQTHGTCVAGMAAGSGYAYSSAYTTNAKFRGMAYESDMVFVGVRRDSIATQWLQGGFSDFANGIGYIFNYANSVSKPAVVNISWGSQSGAHDGTSLFNQACDNLSGPGRHIVMSAGNEGQEHIHLAKTFTAADTMISTNLTFTPTGYQRTWVDVWGEAGKTFCGKATLYRNGSPVSSPSFVCLDNNTHLVNLVGSNGTDTCIVEFINTLADQNGKPRMTINVYNKTTDTVRIDVKGTSGAINMWNEYYYYGYDYKYQSAFSKLGQSWATEGDTISTVSDMGAAKSVLLVGAYVSKTGWTDINSNSWNYGTSVAGRMAGFSSVGPMIDGRVKPDIAAPGLTIATACNSYDTAYSPTGSSSAYIRVGYTNPATSRAYYYSEFTGTSAASPAAAGIVAILLQADPNLTPWDLKAILKETAIKDTYTGALTTPSNTWGSGKINAYGAVKRVLQHLGVYSYTGTKQLDCVVYPNPGTGNFVVDYTGSRREALKLEVIGINGALALSDSWQVNEGVNRRSLDLGALAKGTYLIRVSGRDGAVNIKTVLK